MKSRRLFLGTFLLLLAVPTWADEALRPFLNREGTGIFRCLFLVRPAGRRTYFWR